MYKLKCSQMNIKECFLTHQVTLNTENRWVKFAELIEQIKESQYLQ